MGADTKWQRGGTLTLQDLGNIGELISGIAVVISLIYLAVQIRQNTRTVRTSTYQTVRRQTISDCRWPQLGDGFQFLPRSPGPQGSPGHVREPSSDSGNRLLSDHDVDGACPDIGRDVSEAIREIFGRLKNPLAGASAT